MARKAPEQMFEHVLDTKKGWFDMSALDFAGQLHADVEFDVPAGRVLHLDSVEHAADVGTGGGGQKPQAYLKPGAHQTGPALFNWQGSYDFDVSNPGTTPSGLFMHKAISPAGNLNTLVALGGYELESTEFDADQTYEPNQLLTAEGGDAEEDETTSGVLTNQGSGSNDLVQQFVDPVVGIVSTGEHKNHNQVQTLAFWTAWLPGAFQA